MRLVRVAAQAEVRDRVPGVRPLAEQVQPAGAAPRPRAAERLHRLRQPAEARQHPPLDDREHRPVRQPVAVVARRHAGGPDEPQPALSVALGEQQLRLHLLPELDEARRADARLRRLQHGARLGQVAAVAQHRHPVDLRQRRRHGPAGARRPRQALDRREVAAVVERRLQRDVERPRAVELVAREPGRRVVPQGGPGDEADHPRPAGRVRGRRQREHPRPVARDVESPRRPRRHVGRLHQRAGRTPREARMRRTSSSRSSWRRLISRLRTWTPRRSWRRVSVASPRASHQRSTLSQSARAHQRRRGRRHHVLGLAGLAGGQERVGRLLRLVLRAQRPAVAGPQRPQVARPRRGAAPRAGTRGSAGGTAGPRRPPSPAGGGGRSR